MAYTKEQKETAQKISKAFRALRKCGYFSKRHWWCCQSCGTYAVPNEFTNAYVFAHSQDEDSFRETGKMYLAWAGDGSTIVGALRNAGCNVFWEGSDSVRIQVSI